MFFSAKFRIISFENSFLDFFICTETSMKNSLTLHAKTQLFKNCQSQNSQEISVYARKTSANCKRVQSVAVQVK